MKKTIAILLLLPICSFAHNVSEIKPENVLSKKQLFEIEILKSNIIDIELCKNKEAINIKPILVFVDIFKTKAKVIFA